MPDLPVTLHPDDTVLNYTAMGLERHGDLRMDPDWLREQLASDRGIVLPLWQDKSLFRVGQAMPEVAWVSISDAALFLANAVEVIYLGHNKHQPVFAADLRDLDEKRVQALLDHAVPAGKFIDLRRLGTLLGPEDGSVLAYARALAGWHRNNGFCARCGTATNSMRGGHMRHCSHCEREHFPRIDPAVIMLVELSEPPDGVPRCLLGRHTGLPGRMYSTLAGFVDPGETLEQAVAREVREESGIRVDNIHYVASQPWPFPGSLMLGFRATSTDLEPDNTLDELEDVRWFTLDEIREFGEYGSDSGAACELPRSDSIARLLIEQWIRENSQT